jgi:2-keto-3-deoxy-L-rhamnonate aldolase RhmA/quercetin dioxygenase-like cupin family protein
MKTAAIQTFREKLKADQALCGIWCTLESPSITEMAVGLGLDWVVIDAEHGHLDWKEIAEHIRATVRSHTVALVRLSHRDTSLTKRALDIGADGIVIPWCETRQQVEEAVKDSHFPIRGRRGIGGERATGWGQCFVQHTREANDHVLVIPMIESVGAIEAVDAMCGVDGIETFFFGPADFSSSAGHRGLWEGPGVAEQILQLKEIIRKNGKHCGLMVTSNEDLLNRHAQGFQMLGVGSDTGLLLRSLHESLRIIGRDRSMAPSFDPADGQANATVLSKLPAGLHPDRRESVTTSGQSETIELCQGVCFARRTGEFNNARQLTTGIVIFEPEATLACHTHPCSETITVLEGEFESVVEGRVYRLGPLDTMVIPRWCPHLGRNPNDKSTARVHLAMATQRIEADRVTRRFDEKVMPMDSSGMAGFESVCRFGQANRNPATGPGEESVDYYNADLVAGIELSGGFTRLQPGGQWPAYLLEVDASIYVVQGGATCMIEGRKYEIGNGDAIMIPRGRIHRIINESDKPIEVLWVYASPRPDRMATDPRCATREGNPWKGTNYE